MCLLSKWILRPPPKWSMWPFRLTVRKKGLPERNRILHGAAHDDVVFVRGLFQRDYPRLLLLIQEYHHNPNVRSCRGKGSTLCNLCTCALKGILLERKLTVVQICRLFASFHGSTNRIIVTSWVGLFPTGFPQITAHTHTQTHEGFRNISFHLSLSLSLSLLWWIKTFTTALALGTHVVWCLFSINFQLAGRTSAGY